MGVRGATGRMTIGVDGAVVSVAPAERRPAGVDPSIDVLWAVEVDGILRGYVGYVKSHRSGIGWRTYSLLPRPTHRGSSIAGHVSSESVPGSGLDGIVRSFPSFVRAGRLPSLDEVGPMLAAADAENRRRDAARDADARRHASRAEEAESTRLRTIEGLESVRDRLKSELTNFEAAAVADALAILSRPRRG